MKMKSSMKLKAIMIITMLGMSLAGYAQAQKKDGTFASESGMEMQVDSMVYKNESRPVYYARYGNRGCLFELRINDNASIWSAASPSPARVWASASSAK